MYIERERDRERETICSTYQHVYIYVYMQYYMEVDPKLAESLEVIDSMKALALAHIRSHAVYLSI